MPSGYTEEWCGGFWPGVLWYDYEYGGEAYIGRQARNYTASLAYLADRDPYDHDLGFLVHCSFGNGMRIAPCASYRDVIVGTANQLAKLFNPRIGTILSWPREVEKQGWPHNTIMDNMINLEMLFWASRNGGGQTCTTSLCVMPRRRCITISARTVLAIMWRSTTR